MIADLKKEAQATYGQNTMAEAGTRAAPAMLGVRHALVMQVPVAVLILSVHDAWDECCKNA